mgnify:CR=1 FL=1
MAWIYRYLTTVIHDQQITWYLEYHSSLCSFPWTLQRFLYLPLVTIFLFFRIFRWSYVVWTSFIAGIIQTALYADFMYYFFKANQNEKFVVFPVWYKSYSSLSINIYLNILAISKWGWLIWIEGLNMVKIEEVSHLIVMDKDRILMCLCILNICGIWWRILNYFLKRFINYYDMRNEIYHHIRKG